MSDEQERRAESILADLLEQPPADRHAALAATCGSDAALAERVRVLLEAFAAAGDFLSSPTVDPAHIAGVRIAPTFSPTAERPGSRIGRYRLLEQIGEGGFGVVFMAEQDVPVRRQVALKVIKLGMDTAEVVARFEAERQALATMDHPNIAKVLDAGATDAGRPYFIMELVRGSPLTEYCDKRKLNTAQRVTLLEQVCRAVQHAHSKGVIHRDLKPNNILVTTVDDKPVPKVIDFGIAKATQGRLTDRTLFTGFRQLIGTPQYMSPEQADSDGTDVDTRTDVYSLGVLLYELLVGTTPFDARVLRSVAYDAMRRMIREQEPPKPSTRLSGLGETLTAVASARGTDPKRLGQLVRGELDWIVMRAMEKNRSRRYETAAAMADDLGRYRTGEAVVAGPVSGAYRLRKWAMRHRAAIGVAAAVTVALLLGVAGTTIGLIRESHQRRVAEARRVEADQERSLAQQERQDAIGQQREAERQRAAAETQRKAADTQRAEADAQRRNAQAVVDFLTGDVLAKASPDVTNDPALSESVVKALFEPALNTLDSRFKDQPLIRASVQQAMAEVLYDVGRFDLAAPQAESAWQGREKLLGPDDADTLTSQFLYGDALFSLSRYAEAEPLLRQVWERRRRTQGQDNPGTLNALGTEAGVLSYLGRFADALPLLKLEWERLRVVSGETDHATLESLAHYAELLALIGKAVEAEPPLRMLNDLARRARADDSVRGSYLFMLGKCLTDQKKWLQAEPILREEVAFDRVHGEASYPRAAEGLSLLNQCLMAEGKPTMAAPATAEVATTATALDVVTSTTDAHARLARGYAAVQDGDATAAAVLLRQASDYFRRFAPDDPDRDHALFTLGRCLMDQQDLAGAEPPFGELLDHYHSGRSSVDSALAARTLYYLGHADLAESKAAAAEPLFRELLALSRNSVPQQPEYVANALTGLGIALAQLGPAKAVEAEADLRAALSIHRKWAGPRSVLTTNTAASLADLLARTGRASEASSLRVEFAITATTQP